MSRRSKQPRRPRSRPATDAAPALAQDAASWPRAGVFVRLIALIYDGLLLIALTAVLNTILIAIATPASQSHQQALTVLSPAVREGLLLPATIAVIFAFYGYCWTRSGQTLGMQTWRLTLRRGDGHLPTWRDSLRRFAAAAAVPAISGLVSWLLRHDVSAFALSVLVGFLFNYAWQWLRTGGNLHDQLSGTEVLHQPPRPRAKRSYRFLGLFGDRED